MNDHKFVMYTFLTTLIWGGLVYFLQINTEASKWYVAAFPFLMLLVIDTDKNYKKDKSIYFTKKLFASIFLFIIGVALFIYMTDIIFSYMGKEAMRTIFYVIIGAVWSHQMNYAWYSNKKYNKSLKAGRGKKRRAP